MTDRPAPPSTLRKHALVVTLLAAALLPLGASAQARKTPAPTPAPAAAPRAAAPAPAASPVSGRWELGFGAGLATPLESGIDTGPKAAVEGLYGLRSLTPSTVLQLGGSLAWSYNAGTQGSSLHTFELVPVARVRAQVAPAFLLLGEFGVGLAVLRARELVEQGAGQPLVAQTNTETSAVIKLGGGLGYDLGRQWSLTLSPAFCIYARSSSVTQFTLLLGALYRP